MKIDKEIFNSLLGKAGGAFNDVNTYLEIGVREGNTFRSRVPLVNTLAVAIDCWDLFENNAQNDMNRSRQIAKEQYEKLASFASGQDKAEVIRSFSNNPDLLSKFDDGFFDLIFIDGDHSYEGVKEDLNNWWGKCNTLFCGHDYMESKTVWNGVECGVKRAVDEFIQEKESEILHFRVYRGSNNPTWFIWKR